ncbi:MAG TPA: lysylphosphatidylglycerol synthase transmembrane domain-containing protein [Bryobacteraceae bacterium]|nr:lysylphosphatidylglycerol synthase transmembrane domain-containing protein [Bryobacteraceae bacterium]
MALVAALAAMVLLAWWGLRSRGFNWKVFWSTFRALDRSWLAAAIVFALATYIGRALRWAVLMRPVKPNPSILALTSATAIGFAAITVLGRPGEFVRPYLIAVKERVPVSSQFAALLLERIFDLLMALLIFGFALSRVHHSEVHAGPALSWVLAVGGWMAAGLGLTCLVVLLLIRTYGEAMRIRLLEALRFLSERRYARAERLVNAFVQGVESTRSLKSLVMLTVYTVVEWILIAGSILALVRAYGNALPFGLVDVLIFMGFLAFGAVVQVPGIGGGVQVVSVLVLTELFRVPLEVATSAAMLLWAITFVAIVPIGLVLAFHEGLNWSKLKQLEQEVGE